MIAKNIIGRSFRRLCRYLLSKVEKGQGQILETRGVRETKNEMIEDFNLSRHYNPNLTRCVWHAALSFDNKDQLSDSQQLEIAKDWMKRMGLIDSQYAIVKHTDTDHNHLHVIVNRIADDGHTISDSNNYKRSESICRELEKKYNLTPVPSIRNEREINHEKLKGRDAFKSECHLALQEVLKGAKDANEFNLLMKEKEIDCIWKYNPDGSPRGLTFQKGDQKIKASDINRIYSASRIQGYIEYKNQRRVVNTAKKVKRDIAEAGYQFSRAIDGKPSIDDDIIAIDKVVLQASKIKKLKI